MSSAAPSEGLSPMQTAAAASVCLHILAFLLLSVPSPQYSPTGSKLVEVDLDSLETAGYDNSGILAVESGAAGGDSDEAKAAEARRTAFLKYLDEVSEAVHRHRLDSGDTSLIGLAELVFEIDARGCFRSIRLKKSSGSSALDAAALNAVRAASGEVKRPPVLGTGTLTVFEEVRFQYGLK